VTITAAPTANPSAATATVTAFVTTAVQTSGISPATTGGIAGGIAGGFLLLGALLFVYITRGSRNRNVANGDSVVARGEMAPAFQEAPKPRGNVRDSQLIYPDFDENLESGRTHDNR
jgi:hypothetical protein